MLQADGQTLHLAKKLSLPPGPITVSVQSTEPKIGLTMLEVLDHIHQDQHQRGRKPLTETEMATEIEQIRSDDNEYEERWQNIWSQTDNKPKTTDKS
jgi:hypothetical protein